MGIAPAKVFKLSELPEVSSKMLLEPKRMQQRQKMVSTHVSATTGIGGSWGGVQHHIKRNGHCFIDMAVQVNRG